MRMYIFKKNDGTNELVPNNYLPMYDRKSDGADELVPKYGTYLWDQL